MLGCFGVHISWLFWIILFWIFWLRLGGGFACVGLLVLQGVLFVWFSSTLFVFDLGFDL